MGHQIIMAILIFTSGLTSMAYALEAQSDDERILQTLDRRAKEVSEFAAISPILVAAPLDRWVLLRKDDTVCALRFTLFQHERAKDKIPSWVTDSFFANYDWFCQGDGSQDLRKSNVKSGHGEASKKPNIWRIERGTPFVKCGSIRAQWWYPSDIYLIDRNYRIPYDPKISDQPNDIEIALTGWKNINDVNAKDLRLIWHRYDTQRDPSQNNDPPTLIPVEKLPGNH